MQFSRSLAICGGVLLPIAETLRRWQQLGDIALWPMWLDDWLIGAFLLYGAWKTSTNIERGRPALAAAWGFACAMGYMSFFSQLAELSSPDPSGLPSTGIVALKGVMLVFGVIALVSTLRDDAR